LQGLKELVRPCRHHWHHLGQWQVELRLTPARPLFGSRFLEPTRPR
jgi:hypothetical protein